MALFLPTLYLIIIGTNCGTMIRIDICLVFRKLTGIEAVYQSVANPNHKPSIKMLILEMVYWVNHVYLVAHPTNRFCGLVHPNYKWMNTRSKNPIF